MRLESSVTSVSWIPSEAVTGIPKAGFVIGTVHYDDPPPDILADIDQLYAAEKFRFANRLAAWIEVADGRVVDGGYSGRGYMSRTRVKLAPRRQITFHPAEFPVLQAAPEVRETTATFVQTTGGRTGMPVPRRVTGKPYVQWASPTVWTTLRLTLDSDGTTEYEVIGASTFPRHWIYDGDGHLVAKSGLASSRQWFHRAFGPHSPWGDEDTTPLIAVAESALERELSASIMRGATRPRIRRLPKGSWLTRQGERGGDVYLLLDGVLIVSVDGSPLGELGPGAIVGERAALGDGTRTASLQALTDCVVAAAPSDQIDQGKLEEVAAGHRREEQETV